MISTRLLSWRRCVVALSTALVLLPGTLLAHCDGWDGPVVQAARQALATGNVNFVLIWVQPVQEEEIRQAFAHCLAVRTLGERAQELADRFFFETLVRVHRAGEGAPFTGLKPAGRDLGPAIPAADRALETGDMTALVKLLDTALHEGLERRFHAVTAARNHAPDDVAAGRRFVAAYVAYVHYVERLHADAVHSAEGHFAEKNAESPAHAHED
jgi:hypothetical protein